MKPIDHAESGTENGNEKDGGHWFTPSGRCQGRLDFDFAGGDVLRRFDREYSAECCGVTAEPRRSRGLAPHAREVKRCNRMVEYSNRCLAHHSEIGRGWGATASLISNDLPCKEIALTDCNLFRSVAKCRRMLVVPQFRSCAALAVFAVGFLGFALADEKDAGKVSDERDVSSEEIEEAEPAESVGPELQGLSLLSEGKPSYGVRIPNFEGDVLVSLTDIEVLTKLPNGNLLIEKMVFTKFDEFNKVSMIVEVELGIYNTDDDRLTSTHQTVIRGDGFYAVGEGCIFRQGSSMVELTGIVNSKFADDLSTAKVTGRSDEALDSEKENLEEIE